MDRIRNTHAIHYTDRNEHCWVRFRNEFGAEEIERVIMGLSDEKDTGPMQINTNILKQHSQRIAKVLAKLFILFVTQGTFPNKWKESYIIALPKRGSPHDVANYRGICIQSSLAKIFDKLFTKRIEEILLDEIPQSQYGFVERKGTITNLLETTEYINENIRGYGQVDGVYVDMSKAFNSISHTLLIEKLAKMSTRKISQDAWPHSCAIENTY